MTEYDSAAADLAESPGPGAHPQRRPSASPAEAAILAAGIPVEQREMPALIRRVERRMPADAAAVRAALIELRRRGWVARLNDLANRAGRVWVRRAEAEAAAGTIAVLEPDDATLLAALDAAVAARLRGLGPTPEAALEAVAAEILEAGSGALSADRHAALAREVAAAFGLAGDAALPFLDQVGAVEARRRRDVREAEAASRAKRREEVQRLRDWERSLVDFRALPGLLGASQKGGAEMDRRRADPGRPAASRPAARARRSGNSTPPRSPPSAPASPPGGRSTPAN